MNQIDPLLHTSLRPSDETLMHFGHDLWLATLKWVGEAE